MSKLTIYYNGTIESLKNEVSKLESIINRSSSYHKSIKYVKDKVIPNFDRYKNDYGIYAGDIHFINSNFWKPSRTDKKESIYSVNYSIELFLFIIFFLVIFVIICLYCYICDIDVILFNKNILLGF